MTETLPTGRLARSVNAVVAHGEELHQFSRFLMDRQEIDPSSPAAAAGLASLYARLRQVVTDAQEARDLAAFYVRSGRGEKAA